MTTAASVEANRNSCPFLTITLYTCKLDYDSIKKIHHKLKANTNAVSPTLGGGTQGPLCLAMTNVSYLAITCAAFFHLIDQNYLSIITYPSMAAQTSKLGCQHKNSL